MQGRWIRKDCGWRSHPKMLHAIHLAGGGRLGRQVKWLWDEALSESCDTGLDGLIPAYRLAAVVESAGLTKPHGETCTVALIGSGLWHSAETVGDCEHCAGRTMEPGDVYFHDIDQYQRMRADVETPEAALKDLQHLAMRRDDRLRKLIFARDEGLCRYCGIPVTTNVHDHRSPGRLTHDHIDPGKGLTDPDRGNNMESVVIACAACNEQKGERTPEQAEMTLWAPGSDALAVGQRTAEVFRGGIGPDGTGVAPGSDRVGIGSVPGPSWVRPGSVPGPGQDGPERPADGGPDPVEEGGSDAT